MQELVVQAVVGSIREVTAWIDAELEKLDCALKAQMQVDVAIDEIFTNIASYAYPEGPGNVTIQFHCENRTAEIVFIDSGIPFNPLENPDPDITLPADQRPIGGLGVFLARKLTDEIGYRYENGKNVLFIRKRI